MKAKICFENEIYKISKLPKTFEELKQLIPTLFRNQLPQSWTLQYSDSDGDNILLASEKEYEDVFGHSPGLNSGSNMIKICIVSTDNSQGKPQEEAPTELIKYKSEDGFQIISDDEDGEEVITKTEKKEVVSKEEKPQEQKEVKVNNSQIMKESKKDTKEETKGPIQEPVVDHSKKVEKKPEEEVKEVAPKTNPKVENKDLIEKKPVETKAPEDKDEESLNKEIHHGVSCKGCNMKPIVGVRYKCTVCSDFSYCGSCEKKLKHDHHFIKMKYHDVVDSLKLNPVQQEKDKEKKKEEAKKREDKKPAAPKTENKKQEELAFMITKPETHKFTKEEREEQNKLKDIEEKANKLYKCFPKEDICRILVYVSEAPEDMTFEELVENFKH